MSKINYLTPEGYKRIKSELEEMKGKGRSDISKAIAEAREKGDLSENAEYHAAKEEQGMLEMRINELEKAFANARILEPKEVDTSKVGIMCRVKIKNKLNNKTMEYMLVSESESNLKEKKISVDSPIARGLLGLKKGDVAKVTIPAGQVEFEILDISAG